MELFAPPVERLIEEFAKLPGIGQKTAPVSYTHLVAAGEGIALTEGAARLIARLADGAMRDALSMLDRAAAAGAVDEKTVTATLGVMGQDDGIRLAEHLKTGDLADVYKRQVGR